MDHKEVNETELALLIGNKIRQYRTEQSYSQEILAEKSELTTTYIGQVERGVTNPTVNTLYKITGALCITLADLFIDINTSKESDSPELLHFLQYLRQLSPERIQLIHQFLKQLDK